MKLSTLATILHGTLIGSDADFNAITIDSRTVQNGDCFVAIKGDTFDGHDFIADCARLGASVAVVEHKVETTISVIKVKNTRKALADYAGFYRASLQLPVAAITGSCGKTTTRALLENILRQVGNAHASQKSFNNDIGVPLTVLQLNPSHDFAVFEIGTNHPGEIAPLTAITQPTVATVTMAAAVHLLHFKDVAAIAHEKGAIFEGLREDGVAVINADDAFCEAWKKQASKHRVITFGRDRQADVMARDVQSTPDGKTHFTLQLPNKTCTISLPLLGEHNVMNALAAAAMAYAFNISIDAIKMGLETATAVYGRMIEKKGKHGEIIIDDSYNANPTSVKAAIQLLAHRSHHGILVLGDMRELGDGAPDMHREVGECARRAGLQRLFCYGENSAHAANAFGKNAAHFESHQALIDALIPYLTRDTTVLVKGSRSMKMEVVVEALV